ncbi:21405_t:CDS:2 [Entrophospora sp. SA101]|nr:21405_t:CDS:2 [Entrophospora sp. SA101]CAJ0846204.1 12805_t:CDS:2 [Entrophospora sp. SA101]
MHIKAKSIRVTQTQLNGEDKYVNTAAFIDTNAKCCIMNANLADKLEINYSIKLMERMWNVIFLGVKVRGAVMNFQKLGGKIIKPISTKDKGSMYFKEIEEKPLFWGKLPVTVGEIIMFGTPWLKMHMLKLHESEWIYTTLWISQNGKMYEPPITAEDTKEDTDFNPSDSDKSNSNLPDSEKEHGTCFLRYAIPVGRSSRNSRLRVQIFCELSSPENKQGGSSRPSY